MTKIVVAGDSWGLGEWGYDPYEVKHPGLQYYLSEHGYEVTNISIPGGSNTMAVEKLSKHIASNDVDYVFWFQTDPLRDISKALIKSFTTVQQMQDASTLLLSKIYTGLNSLGKTIHCIGGCSKLHPSISNYTMLVPIIPSVIELCAPSFNHVMWFSDWIEHISKDFDDFDELINLKKLVDSLETNTEYREFFYPDGGHANRKAHKIIFNVIMEQLMLKKNLDVVYLH